MLLNSIISVILIFKTIFLHILTINCCQVLIFLFPIAVSSEPGLRGDTLAQRGHVPDSKTIPNSTAKGVRLCVLSFPIRSASVVLVCVEAPHPLAHRLQDASSITGS
jgi:hypothetical protein